MTSDRKSPGVTFWATVVVVVGLVAYPLSFGPACWLTSQMGIGGNALPVIYSPIIARMGAAGSYETFCEYDTAPPTWKLHHCPSGIISRYATLFAVEGWQWRLSVDAVDQTELHGRMQDGQWDWSVSRP